MKYAWKEPSGASQMLVGAPVQVRWVDGVRRGVVREQSGGSALVELLSGARMTVSAKQCFVLIDTFSGTKVYVAQDPEKWMLEAEARGYR